MDEQRIKLGKLGQVQMDQRGEARIFDKVGITINVILDQGFKTKHQANREVTIDISEGGLRFYDDWGLPDHALLEIVLVPAGSKQQIVHYGEVRWKTPAADRPGFEIGVQFTEATRADRDAWLAYVRSRREESETAMLVMRFEG